MTRTFRNRAFPALWAWGLAAVLAGPLAPAARAADAEDVRAVIETTVNAALATLKDKSLDKEGRRKKVLDIVSPVFDFALVAKLTLGRVHWPKLDKGQQKEYTDLFVKMLQDSYIEKVDLLTDESVEFGVPAAAEKGKYEMMTEVLSKGDRHKMLYRLYKKGTAWMIYDVEIEGVSLLKSYSAQYDQFLQKNTVKDLLKRLREKSLAQPAELEAKEKEMKKDKEAKGESQSEPAKPEPEAKPAPEPAKP